METAHWIETLRTEGARMTAAARAVSADSPVPTCPEWVARDLIRHQGGVHRWATSFVADARTEPPSATLEEVAGGWPGDEELGDWFEAGYLALLRALEAAPPDLQCWTFLPAPSALAFWSRRQAHETSIHRVDAELTAGRSAGQLSSIRPEFAADGVDELLVGFMPLRSAKLRADEPVSLAFRCTDVEGSWVLAIGPEGAVARAEAGPGQVVGEAAACSVSGPATNLYLALWNRGAYETLEIEGDRAVLDRVGDAMGLHWTDD
ncbi:MAG TPA: maleylpyruvate isomerase family mycothiol-dependent enzyme [Acidimicrobiales bacterium]|jgi:uncharacterized protein (TIGR03083 family)|nr:maleylpyruvate isomerase family mycothiol-dependent enzyme [Acidimicrobiales bacterium]